MSVSRLTAVFLIYFLAGPPTGGLIYGVLAAIFILAARAQDIGTVLWIVALAVPFSYLAGWVEALVTGIVAALFAWRHGELPPSWVPFVAAVAAALPNAVTAAEDVLVLAMFLIAAGGAAVICHRLTERLAGPESG